MSARKDKRQRGLGWAGSGHEVGGRPGSGSTLGGGRMPRFLPLRLPKFGGDGLGLGAPLAAAPGPGRSAW